MAHANDPQEVIQDNELPNPPKKPKGIIKLLGQYTLGNPKTCMS